MILIAIVPPDPGQKRADNAKGRLAQEVLHGGLLAVYSSEGSFWLKDGCNQELQVYLNDSGRVGHVIVKHQMSYLYKCLLVKGSYMRDVAPVNC